MSALGIRAELLSVSADVKFHSWMALVCPTAYRIHQVGSTDEALYKMGYLAFDLLCIDVDSGMLEWPLLLCKDGQPEGERLFSTALFHSQAAGAVPMMTTDLKYQALIDRDADPLSVRRSLAALAAGVHSLRTLRGPGPSI